MVFSWLRGESERFWWSLSVFSLDPPKMYPSIWGEMSKIRVIAVKWFNYLWLFTSLFFFGFVVCFYLFIFELGMMTCFCWLFAFSFLFFFIFWRFAFFSFFFSFLNLAWMVIAFLFFDWLVVFFFLFFFFEFF